MGFGGGTGLTGAGAGAGAGAMGCGLTGIGPGTGGKLPLPGPGGTTQPALPDPLVGGSTAHVTDESWIKVTIPKLKVRLLPKKVYRKPRRARLLDRGFIIAVSAGWA